MFGTAEAITAPEGGLSQEAVLVVETSFLFDDSQYAAHRLTGVLLFEVDRSALAMLLRNLGAA